MRVVFSKSRTGDRFLSFEDKVTARVNDLFLGKAANLAASFIDEHTNLGVLKLFG